MYESNKLNFYILKIGFPILLIGLGVFYIFILSGFLNINEAKSIKANSSDSDIVFAVFLILAAIFYTIFVSTNIFILKADANRLEFKSGNRQITNTWSEVTVITKLWCIYPNLYFLRFENDKKYYFFTTGLLSYHFIIFSYDASEMGNFIRKRKRELHVIKALKFMEKKEKELLKKD